MGECLSRNSHVTIYKQQVDALRSIDLAHKYVSVVDTRWRPETEVGRYS